MGASSCRTTEAAMSIDTSVFSMPRPMKITGRSSSITNAFANAIIPAIQPTAAEIEQALTILDMSPDDIRCSYCGDPSTEWDHRRPLIKDKRPTGYISEIRNFVPACGKCNQSKGNKNWQEWIVGSARLSPKTRGIKDIDEKIRRIDAYEKQGGVVRVDFETHLSSDLWRRHWDNWKTVLEEMRNAQELADELRKKLATAI